MERLQKVISNSGYCSRRKAEDLITNGKVKVNGQIIRELGIKVKGNDMIEIEGEVLKKEDKEYIILNKPRGVVTTVSDEKNRKTVLDLINTDKRLYPVGRLDYDTTGLVFLTNDGDLTNLITHPKNGIEKEYIAKVSGILNNEAIQPLKKGIVIEGKKTAPAKVKIKKIDKKNNTSMVQMIIHEGRNHQVKKTFEAIGYDVIKLKREKLAFLTIEGLKSGEYRHLTIKEVKKLYNECNK